MTASAFLKDFAKFNPTAARFVYTGIAVFAAGAMIIGFKVDPWAAAKIGAAALCFALVLSLLTYIVNHPLMRACLAWLMVAAIGYVGLCATAAVFPHSPVVGLVGHQPPLTCYLGMFEESLETCEARSAPTVITVSARSSLLLPGPERLWFAQSTQAAQNSTVFLQFSNPDARDFARSVASGLTAAGWGVQGADQGGELVTSGPGGTEVRFFKPEDQQAAVELAKSLSQLTGGEIAVRDFSTLYPMVQQGQFEVWLAPDAAAAPGDNT